jgi:hypothetical protein
MIRRLGLDNVQAPAVQSGLAGQTAANIENNSRTEHDVKPARIRHQKAGPAIKEREPSEICKTSIPGSNPGGASKITLAIPHCPHFNSEFNFRRAMPITAACLGAPSDLHIARHPFEQCSLLQVLSVDDVIAIQHRVCFPTSPLLDGGLVDASSDHVPGSTSPHVVRVTSWKPCLSTGFLPRVREAQDGLTLTMEDPGDN